MATQTISGRIQHLAHTAAALAAANPVLLGGEVAYESDTGRCKLGDGATRWNALSYCGDISASGTLTSGKLLVGAGDKAIEASVYQVSSSLAAQISVYDIPTSRAVLGALSGYYTKSEVDGKAGLKIVSIAVLTTSISIQGGGIQYRRTSSLGLSVTVSNGSWDTAQDAIIRAPHDCDVSFVASGVTLYKAAGFGSIISISGIKVYTLHALTATEIVVNVALYE